MVFVSTNILNVYDRKIVSTDTYPTLIDFLQDKYPKGFDNPTDISVNTSIISIDDYVMPLNNEDIVVLLDRTALPVGIIGGWLITALANMAISVAIGWVVQKLFAPDIPEAQKAPSSVYSLNNSQNAAKLGSPIPVGYGSFRMYPSYTEQPYFRYKNNNEYLYLLLCIGQGKHSLDKLMIDNIDASASLDVSPVMFDESSFENIPSHLYDTDYRMRTNTLSTPSNFDLISTVESEKYSLNSGLSSIEFDYMFPNGLIAYAPNSGEAYGITLSIVIRLYNDADVLVDTFTMSKNGFTKETIRETYTVQYISTYASFTIARASAVSQEQASDKIIITRIKEIYPTPDVRDYGNLTLLWVKIKATNAISSSGQQQVNGFFTRTDTPNDLKSVLTDVYTNNNYGGRLDINDLDFPTTPEKINGVFDTNMTVFDAMKAVASSQKNTVFLAGMDILLKKDGVNNITSGLYNETNILKDSLKVQYLFKEESVSTDGYECSYRDDEWGLQVEKYPATALYPNKVDLFGVAGTGANIIAQDMAKYLFKQEDFRRKIVSFQTDIQGLVPQFLDKILISHSALQWGTAGNVYNVSGTSIELSEPIDSSAQTIVFRNIDGSVSNAHTLTYVDEYNITVPTIDSWVAIDTAYTVQGINTAKEFLVISVKPSSEDSITIECVNYSEEIYS